MNDNICRIDDEFVHNPDEGLSPEDLAKRRRDAIECEYIDRFITEEQLRIGAENGRKPYKPPHHEEESE